MNTQPLGKKEDIGWAFVTGIVTAFAAATGQWAAKSLHESIDKRLKARRDKQKAQETKP